MASSYQPANDFANDGLNQHSKMENSNMTSYSKYLKESEPERAKRRTIKKILLMSTMDKSIQKMLLRILQGGKEKIAKYLVEDEGKATMMEYADSILDKDNQSELDTYLSDLLVHPDRINDNYLKIIKFFVLSPIEKQYIVKIEAEISEGESLDSEIA